MKIVIPTDQNIIETGVCPSFGRTPYFLVYNTDNKQAEFLDNSAAAIAGGAGIKAAQSIVDAKAEIVLTPRCGENAATVLYGAKIKIYKTINGSAMYNINAFLGGNLSCLDEIHAGFHNHGNK